MAELKIFHKRIFIIHYQSCLFASFHNIISIKGFYYNTDIKVTYPEDIL